MRAEEILKLLPPEFDKWKPGPLLLRREQLAEAQEHVSR